MRDNAFGPNGVVSFDFWLKSNTFLTHLDITNCGLGPEGTEMIANALLASNGTKLKQLHISRNRVENKGSLALASYLSTYNTLEVLEIYQNGIYQEGLAAILQSI
jgi:Ran GTPase-activating protein (RanGAP) involved in mRNA processing and transport